MFYTGAVPPIAQLVEQSPLKRTVLGSSPSGRTIKKHPRKGVFLISTLVPGMGIEPITLAGLDFKSSAYTNSATRALWPVWVQRMRKWTLRIRIRTPHTNVEAWAGIEPAHVGFADRSVTTSPPGQYVIVSCTNSNARVRILGIFPYGNSIPCGPFAALVPRSQNVSQGLAEVLWHFLTRACRFCRPKRYHFATRPPPLTAYHDSSNASTCLRFFSPSSMMNSTWGTLPSCT